MVDIATLVVEIAKYLVAPVGRPFRYLWNYKTNLENLKNEVEKLEAKRDTVQLSIKPGENPMPDVKLWQKSANQTIVEASKVVEDNPEQANIQCCKGFSCPNLINRYQRGKNAAEKLKEVLKLEQEAVPWLAQISSRTNIPDDPWLRSDDGYEAFDSRSSVLKNIIDALRDPNVNMVGIYGMGGIGKTTLAQKVAIHTKQDNLFHVIVFVEVSKTPDIKNIQQEIGGKLGLKFHDKTEGERARELYDQLKKDGTVSVGADDSGEEKKEKKILLILDNIWGKIDLEKVGIPLGGDCKGLKLLLTTRSIHVLTNQMNSLHNFSVETLEEAEAWSLFKSTAGMCVDHPDLKNIAPKVAKECGNLPLAIVTIASALKDKEESTWSTALNELKNPSLEGFEETMTREVYTCIKFSYDHLDTKELKEIFLLCSRMGRTYDASIRDLFMYGLGLGFFKRFNTLEEAQCKVEDLVKKLKGNSLLLDAPNETRESLRHVIPDGERFAMHDIICDVVRLIDRQKGNVCNVIDDAISCRWAKTNILKNCTSITLYNISEVPEDLRLELPHLEFFYMKTKDSFSKIVDDFFVKMPSLLVLHLIEMNLSPLPTSLSNLINLQTLCLDACKLGDIADIGKLEKLEFLSFCGSEIRELPDEMRQLTSIRLLDLNDCSELEIIPPNFLSCFTQLEALYMYNILIKWKNRGLNIGRILDELKHLRGRLTTLEICIPNVKMSEGLLSPHLKRYKISIDRDRISPPMNSRTLRVKLTTNDNADEVISQLKGIKQLELGCTNRRYGFTADSKQSVSLDALSSLESLSVEDLYFEKICNVPLAAESFCQLRTITVHRCDKLINIFSFSIDRVLPKLQEIRVSYCKNMEGIFAIEREDDVNNSELIHEIQFSQLCSVTLIGLPQLKSFCHRVKTTSQLQLTSSTNDGEIISEDMIDIPKSLFNEKVVLPNLNSLYVNGCHNLKELFSSSMVNSFVQLQYLEISECFLLEEVVFMEELTDEERKDTQFPFLKEMKIKHCPNFKGFISNDHKIGFPSLKEMEIRNCPKLKHVIFNDKVVFPNLETLQISGISVEKIWHNQLPTMSSSFQNLNRLDVYICDNLKELFSSSMVNSFVQLQYLKIFSCSLLEEVVFMEELKEEERKDTQFPFLKEMKIIDCPNFKGFISNDKIGFPSLKEMEITWCPKFKEFIFNDKVAVPNLEKLTIVGMGNLEKIWHDQLVKDSFCKLKSLTVYECTKLLNVFPSNICERLLSSLESLEVSWCYSLEEIFDLRELSIYDSQIMLSFESLQRLEVSVCQSLKNLFSASILAKEGVVMEEAPARFLFPKLTSFKLNELPELRSFYPGRHKVEGPVLKTKGIHDIDEEGQMQQPFFCSSVEEIGFPSLKEMKIGGSDKFKEFIFNDKVAVPNIEKLTISWMDNLEKIWHNQFVKDSFCKLKSLKVYKCKKLLNVFPSNICERLLSSLEHLDVSECGSLEEIFDLRELSIYDSQIMLSFANLQELRVSECGSLKNLFSASILAKEVVMEEAPARFLFPKLTFFELNELSELRSFYPGRHKVEGPVLKTKGIHDIDEEGQMQQPFVCSSVEEIGFPSLKEMEIKICHKLKEFIFNDKVAVPNLEKLTIGGMNKLEKIWHNQLVKDSFCKLKSLDVYGCKKLLNVFPSNICGRLLSSLESLGVMWCDSLEEIFDLRELSIHDSQIMLSFKSLQRLRVARCQSLKNLFSASILAKEGVMMEEAPARFLFPKLTSLELNELSELRSFYPGKHKVEGPVFKTLELSDCGIHDTDEDGRMQQPLFPSLVEEEFPCLEKLSLDGVQVTMLCQGQFLESLFDRLKILEVGHDESTVLPFGIIQRCQNLEELSFHFCSYEEIFPHREDLWKQNPSTSFQHLTSLTVRDCNSLINIGTSSVAKSLVQLTEMIIISCKKITEVIGYHGDVIEDEIIFIKLKSLKLQSLPSLTSFCSWNFTLKFPSLETLTVQQCPNMKIFFKGDLTTEKLQKVYIDYKSLGLCRDFDLNTAIQQSYEKANPAKDNGASSSHHFEIDQESTQQSHEEAIQQPHEEANEDYCTASGGFSE